MPEQSRKQRTTSLRPLALLWLLPLLLVIPLRDNWPGAARAEYAHAWRLFETGYLALSQQEAQTAAREYRISNPAWSSRFQLLQAESMLFRGMYEDALNVLSTYRNSTNPSDGTVEKLAIEAVALTRQQQIPTATQDLAEADNLCRANDFPACGDAIAARAILATKVGQLASARESFLAALSFARSHGNVWLQVSSDVNLGYVAMQVDHYDEAVDWSGTAYQTAVKMGYENLALNAAGNLGWAYYELGDDDRALQQFLSAQKSAARLGNLRNQLKWLSTAGYVYRDSGDWSHAVDSYRQALTLALQINSHEDIVNAYEDLAQTSVSSGNLDDASTYIAQVAPMESTGNQHPSATLRLAMGELAAARHQYAQASTNFVSIQKDSASLMTTRLTAGYELSKLFELQNNTSAAEQMYRTTLSTYDAARAQLKSEELQLPFGANAIQIYDSYIRLLIRQGKTDAALAVADQSRARTLEQNIDSSATTKLESVADLNPQRIAQSTNSTLLFYWLSDQQSYLWAVTPSKTALFSLPGEQQIAVRIERYRQSLLDLSDPIESANADAQALYQQLLAPAAALLHPNTPVIILADGVLSQLNFETLLVPGPSPTSPRESNADPAATAQVHYLLDDLTLSSAPSLAMLAAAKPISDAGQRMLILGNPVSPNQDFPNLPMFAFEMTHVENHFAPSQLAVLSGQQATPAAYLASRPLQYSYIHFVSHAVASSTNPLDSAIILSSSTSSENSYKLYARDIIQRPIDARLVTISACDGVGTRAYAGEGLVGLTWAFLRAGAQRVIGALWEVSDESTPLLMDNLYQGLSKGATPAIALRQAKLTLLHSPSRFRLPYYWAPFQIYSRR